MFLAEIGTAGVISAYFFRHFTSGYSLNVSDPIEGQPVQLSDYLCFFGYGLVFWLLVLLRAKLYGSGDRQADIRNVAKLAKLITPITTLNLCGSLLAPFMKLPLLVRFLVLFQVSSNLALLLIWAFLSLKECMILLDAHTQQQQKSSPEPQAVHGSLRSLPKSGGGCCGNLSKSRGGYRGYLRFSGQIKRILPKFSSVIGSSTNYEGMPDYPLNSSSSGNLQHNTVQANSAKKSAIIRMPIAMQVAARREGMPDYPLISSSSADSQRNSVRANSAKKSAIIQMPIAMQVAARREGMPVAVHEVDLVSGKVDEAGGSGSGHGSGASGREENRGRYGGNDGGGGAGGGGDRGASGSGHDSAASGSGENSGGYGGHGRDEGGTGSGHGSGAGGSGSGENRGRSVGGDRGRDGGHGSGENRGRYGVNDGGGGAGGGGDRGASGSGHGSGASGSGENRGRSEGGVRGRDWVVGDPESVERETNTEQAVKSSKITEISLTLTGQTTATLVGYHLIPTPSSSSKALLVVALMDQLVGYLCGVTSILLSSNTPEAAKIFADIGFGCSTLGFILMIAMYVAWYLVLIVVLLFGVVWVISFRNGLKTRGTEVWNYLKNALNL